MKRKAIKWLGRTTVAVAVYLGGSTFIEANSREFVQVKTGIAWPEGTEHIRTFECPGLRPHWVEAFVVLPQVSLNRILGEHFTPYDPTLTWNEENPPPDFSKWVDQCKAFPNPTDPLRFFFSRGKITERHLTLGPHVYFFCGDNTGYNRFKIVVDSTNGNTWIHVSYPD